MTTPTPTSKDPGAREAGTLPDPAALSRLANELFRAVPGAGPAQGVPPAASTRPVNFGPPPAPGVPVPGGSNLLPQPTAFQVSPPFPVSQSAVAGHLAPPSVITPRVLPTPAQTPDAHAFTTTLQPLLGRNAGPVAGVPEAFGAVPSGTASTPAFTDSAAPPSPSAAAIPVTPASPFYFLDLGSGAPQTRGHASEARTPSVPRDFTDRAPDSARAPGRDWGPGSGPRPDPGLPSVAGAPVPPNAPMPSTPYYFVGESSGHPAAVGGPPATVRGPESPDVPAGRGMFDVNAVRRDFPILRERVNGRPLIWFDNAATTQKPQSVIDRLAHFYAHENSNIHRAAHELAARATDAYESARNKVTKFLGASSAEEIIFVRGATEAINLVAFSWGRQNIRAGDEIVVSHLEHHANIVPWQMLASEKGARLRVIPVDDTGQVRLDEYQKLLCDRTKIVAVTQVSNALGTVVPVKDIVDMGHRAGAKVLIDGAQAVSHLRVNVQALDADFYVFSGHKIFGPTGIGVVYGKRSILADMPPYQGGGNMIQDVTFDKTVYHGPPARFEAGTGNIADAVGLGAALDYVERIGLETIARYEHELLEYGTAGLCTVPGLCLVGTAKEKTSVMSFTLDGYKNDDVGKALNQDGIAVRTGHHCAQPILRRFGVESTVRPSIAFYNTFEELDVMVAALHRLVAKRARR